VINDILNIANGKSPMVCENGKQSRSFDNHRAGSNCVIIDTSVLAVIFLALGIALAIMGLEEMLAEPTIGDCSCVGHYTEVLIEAMEEEAFEVDEATADMTNVFIDEDPFNPDVCAAPIGADDNTFAPQDRLFLSGVPTINSQGSNSTNKDQSILGNMIAKCNIVSSSNGRVGMGSLVAVAMEFGASAVLLIIGLLFTA
jgi:hypothetical protein